MSGNNMDGVLPDAIGDLEDLGEFYVSSNLGLRGPLPPSMARWRKLYSLHVYDCSFRGGAFPALDFAKLSSNCYLLSGAFACPWPAGATATCRYPGRLAAHHTHTCAWCITRCQ